MKIILRSSFQVLKALVTYVLAIHLAPRNLVPNSEHTALPLMFKLLLMPSDLGVHTVITLTC